MKYVLTILRHLQGGIVMDTVGVSSWPSLIESILNNGHIKVYQDTNAIGGLVNTLHKLHLCNESEYSSFKVILRAIRSAADAAAEKERL